MKQISKIAMVMVITTVFVFLTACGGSGGSGGSGGGVDITGQWNTSAFEMDGESYTMAELEAEFAAYGMDMSSFLDIGFEFKGDDVVVMSYMGAEMEGSYSVSGNTVTVTIEGEPQDLTLDGDRLVMQEESTGLTMYFTK